VVLEMAIEMAPMIMQQCGMDWIAELVEKNLIEISSAGEWSRGHGGGARLHSLPLLRKFRA
jgi:hypothetical protein